MELPRYPSLSEYGVVGDLRTCCLVSRYGSVDWCCLPGLESPSVFGALLDADRGGRFRLHPVQPYQSAQQYVDGTNVLTTEFYAATGRASLTDWMPFPEVDDGGPDHGVLYRRVECTDGPLRFNVEFSPRFDYAREVPRIERTEQGVVARGKHDDLYLTGPTSFDVGDGSATATVPLEAGDTRWFATSYGHEEPHDPATFRRRLDAAIRTWQQWVREGGHPSHQIENGRWERLVDRSALALKLLFHDVTGAIAAAPTTSLPEEIGGSRNWDYRYNWIRDAAMTVQALYKLGHVSETKAYFSWLLSKVYEDPASIRPLYGLHGERCVPEWTVDHLEGYRSSAPVRIGNAAEGQRQLDVYGELVLALYETSRYGEAITSTDWAALREIVDHVCEVWTEPDSGIWEVRTEPQHFVHSKVMCWTALDRGIRIVEETAFDGPVERWRRTRDEIRETVIERGYDEDLGSFVRSFEADRSLDAAALLIPIVGFLPFDDPRVQGTIDAVERRLTTDRGLVYRYDGGDGLPGGEGTFVLCSFWLVDALALSGRVAEAESLFEAVLSHASPLGLFSEEIADRSGCLLGNYPQAFSHIGLINSVLYLDRVHQNRQAGPEPLGTESERIGTPTAAPGR